MAASTPSPELSTSPPSTAPLRWTVGLVEGLPQPLDDTRYEIIEGELYVTMQLKLQHQLVGSRVWRQLNDWDEHTGVGVAVIAPGVVFAPHEAAAPDVDWVSRARRLLPAGLP